MKHPSEYTIERYVLGDGKAKERLVIERHLRRCAGCRELEQQMRSFYADVEHELRHPIREPAAPQRSLVRQDQNVDIWNSIGPLPVKRPAMLLTWWQQVRGVARLHPVVSGFAAFSLIGALTLAVLYSATGLFKDKNPSYVHYDTSAGMMEVYNNENERLWEMPSDFLAGAKEGDEKCNMRSTIVSDLNGNGKNLVVTTVRLADDVNVNSLRIIDGTMSVLAKVGYGARQVQFRGTKYEAQFNPFSPIIAGTGKEKSILIISNNGRSPCVVTRYDPSGNVVGEYWHFGDFRGGYAVDLNNDGKDEVVLIGSNDAGSAEVDHFPVIVVLDPSKISGTTECSSTRGFGFPESNAELYYIRLDLNEICHAFQSYPIMEKLLSTSENVLRFSTNASSPDHGLTFPNFEFIFDKRLNAVEVKNEDQTVREIARLKKEGKTSIVLNSAYLEKIKHAIRYWDGEEWTKDVKKVEAPLPAK